jgi:hypothetical protein
MFGARTGVTPIARFVPPVRRHSVHQMRWPLLLVENKVRPLPCRKVLVVGFTVQKVARDTSEELLSPGSIRLIAALRA